MAYNPSLHTTTNKALGVAQANPTDARSYFYDGATFTYRPYASTAEVLSYLTPNTIRAGNFSIYVSNAGVIQEWWFKDGTADANLVQKTSLQGQPAGGDLSGTYPNPTVAKFNGQLPAFYLARANHTGTQAPATIATDTNNRFVTDAQIASWNNAAAGGVTPGNPNVFTALQTVKIDNISETSTDGLLITNTAAATVSLDQFSPRLHFHGSGWRTAATAASRPVDFILELQTQAGNANPTGLMTWSSSINNAAYAVGMTLSDAGVLAPQSLAAVGLVTGSNIAEPSTSSVRFGSDSTVVGTTNVAVGGRNVAGGSNNTVIWGVNCKSGSANIKNVYVGTNINTAQNAANGTMAVGTDITPAASTGSQILMGKTINSNSLGQVLIMPNSTNITNNITGAGAVIIGDIFTNTAPTGPGFKGCVAIGTGISILDQSPDNVVIGSGAKAYVDATYGSANGEGVAVGMQAYSGSWKGIAIGGRAQALAVSANAIGWAAYVNQPHSTMIGRGGFLDRLGTTNFYNGESGFNWFFGGVAAAWTNPVNTEIIDRSASLNAGTTVCRITVATGRDANTTPTLTNVRGAYLRLIGGASTGTAAGGDIELAITLPGGASNNTENADTVMMKMMGATGETQFQKGGTYTSIPSAIVAINSTLRGFLPPRMTTTQRDAIATPAEGLHIYNLTTHKAETWNGTSWI